MATLSAKRSAFLRTSLGKVSTDESMRMSFDTAGGVVDFGSRTAVSAIYELNRPPSRRFLATPRRVGRRVARAATLPCAVMGQSALSLPEAVSKAAHVSSLPPMRWDPASPELAEVAGFYPRIRWPGKHFAHYDEGLQ